MKPGLFSIMQRLKKSGIPVISVKIERRTGVGYNEGRIDWYALCEADTWAVNKAMNHFEGCNPDFALWNTKVRGRAIIAFKIN